MNVSPHSRQKSYAKVETAFANFCIYELCLIGDIPWSFHTFYRADHGSEQHEHIIESLMNPYPVCLVLSRTHNMEFELDETRNCDDLIEMYCSAFSSCDKFRQLKLMANQLKAKRIILNNWIKY